MTGPHQLDPRIRFVWMAGALIPGIVLVLVTAGLSIADVPIAPLVTGPVAVVALVLALVMPTRRWRSWSYSVTSTELIVRFGVVVKVERWLPRTRVQHVDLVSGPIERALGLSQLIIYTAGTREADVVIPGLGSERATALRADLLAWSGAGEDELDSVPEDATAATVGGPGGEPVDRGEPPAVDETAEAPVRLESLEHDPTEDNHWRA